MCWMLENPEHRALAATRLLMKMPTLAAMSYKFSIEQPTQYPRNDLSYAGNFRICCLLSRRNPIS